MLDKLQGKDFIPHLNQAFRIHLDGFDPIELELTDVTEIGDAYQSGGRVPFSLHFLGPVSQQYLQQHIYRLEHEQLGSLELFIVPLGPESGRMRYEAIFT